MNGFMCLGRKAHSWEQLGKRFVRGSLAEDLLVARFAGVLLGYISHLQSVLLLLLCFSLNIICTLSKRAFFFFPSTVEMLRILHLVNLVADSCNYLHITQSHKHLWQKSQGTFCTSRQSLWFVSQFFSHFNALSFSGSQILHKTWAHNLNQLNINWNVVKVVFTSYRFTSKAKPPFLSALFFWW